MPCSLITISQKEKRRIAALRLSDFCQAQGQNGGTLMKNDLGFMLPSTQDSVMQHFPLTFDGWMTADRTLRWEYGVAAARARFFPTTRSSRHLIRPEGSKCDQESANWARSSTYKARHVPTHPLAVWPCATSGRCRVPWRPSLP